MSNQLNQPHPIYSKVLSMQRLADAVNQGYTHWENGTIPLHKATSFIKKFSINYQIDSDRNALARRKRAGLGNAKLLLYWDGATIRWWLLVTQPNNGLHAAHKLEDLKEAFQRTERITLDGYELVQVPKKGTSGTKLTWRMTKDKYEYWREHIIATVRIGQYKGMDKLLYLLFSSPGFAGIRSQIGKLVSLYHAEVTRSGKKDLPKPPPKLFYVRRLKNKFLTVAELMAEQKAGVDKVVEQSTTATASTGELS
jgi:hypothetical protein